MKRLFFTCILLYTTLTLTPDERQKIITLIKSKQELKISDESLNLISETLKHSYFGNRFSNFRRILGAGSEGVVLEVDFQLFPKRKETIPAAVKINYGRLTEDQGRTLGDYVNLMVNREDQFKTYEEDLLVFNLSRHFEKMLKRVPSFKNDVPFVSMIYEAAMIVLKGDDSDNKKYVSVSVTELGSARIKDDFLPNPNGSEEILNSNSQILAKMIVQICYAIWKINDNGFVHGDISLNNIMVARNSEYFTPLIIDFDRMQSLEYLKSTGYPFTKEMLNESDRNYLKYLPLADDPNKFTFNSFQTTMYFNYVMRIPSSIFIPEWQRKMSMFQMVYLVDIRYCIDMYRIFTRIDNFISLHIKKGLISGTQENIKHLREQINLIVPLLENHKTMLPGDELFHKVNEASGLNLTQFDSVNVDLENYFENIRRATNAEVVTEVEKLDVGNNANIILV